MYQAPSAPLSIGQVLDYGIRLFKASFSSVWLFSLVAGVAAIPFNIMNSRVSASLATGTVDPNAMGLFMLTFLIYGVVLLVLYGAIRLRIGGIATGEPLTAGQSLRIALSRSFWFFLTGFIYFLIVGFASVLLLIPGIWLGVALCFATYAVLLERKGPMESIQYSWEIVKGNWWRTAITLLIVTLIVAVVYVLVVFIVGAALGAGVDDVNEAGPLLIMLESIITPLIQVVVLPAFASMIIALYYDLKLRHEGSDLAERIAAAAATG